MTDDGQGGGGVRGYGGGGRIPRAGGAGRSKMYTTTGFTIIFRVLLCARGRCTRGVRESFVRNVGERVTGGAERASGLDRLTAHDLLLPPPPPSSLGFYTSPRREQYKHSVRTLSHARYTHNHSRRPWPCGVRLAQQNVGDVGDERFAAVNAILSSENNARSFESRTVYCARHVCPCSGVFVFVLYGYHRCSRPFRSRRAPRIQHERRNGSVVAGGRRVISAYVNP